MGYKRNMSARRCCPQEKENVFVPEFWWRRFRRYQGPDPWLKADKWDRLAEDYDDLEACTFYRQMVEEIIETMAVRGVLTSQTRVLEIACGTGPYTLRMAPRVAEVVAVDISGKMLERLKQKAREDGLDNIQAIQADWFSYQPQGRFTLVFAAMTPVLNFVETVERMLKLSERYLVLVHWAGIRENLLYRKIHETIFGRPPKAFTATVLNHFNLFYSLGMAPECRLFKGLWVRRRPLEAELKHMLWRLEGEGDLGPQEQEQVRKILEEVAVEGIVETTTKVRIGFVLVDKSA